MRYDDAEAVGPKAYCSVCYSSPISLFNVAFPSPAVQLTLSDNHLRTIIEQFAIFLQHLYIFLLFKVQKTFEVYGPIGSPIILLQSLETKLFMSLCLSRDGLKKQR